MNKSLEKASEKTQKAIRCLASQEKQHQPTQMNKTGE
jgi:hypothetical protein